jgi:hypothetical protein
MGSDIGLDFTVETFQVSPIWYFHRRKRLFLCMGVFGTLMISAASQTDLKRIGHFGLKNLRPTKGATMPTSAPCGMQGGKFIQFGNVKHEI